jgi:hypothetical protein
MTNVNKNDKLLILIDLVESERYDPLFCGAKFAPDWDWWYTYTKDKFKNIKRTLVFCKEKGIQTMNVNYMFKRFGDHEIIQDYKFDFYKKEGQSKIPPYQQFKTIYYAGSSLDQCVTLTRSESYINLKNNDKKLVLDCCIQTVPPRGKFPQDLCDSMERMQRYTDNFIKQWGFSYINCIEEMEKK